MYILIIMADYIIIASRPWACVRLVVDVRDLGNSLLAARSRYGDVANGMETISYRSTTMHSRVRDDDSGPCAEYPPKPCVPTIWSPQSWKRSISQQADIVFFSRCRRGGIYRSITRKHS
jgi:hypothetical protein